MAPIAQQEVAIFTEDPLNHSYVVLRSIICIFFLRGIQNEFFAQGKSYICNRGELQNDMTDKETLLAREVSLEAHHSASEAQRKER